MMEEIFMFDVDNSIYCQNRVLSVQNQKTLNFDLSKLLKSMQRNTPKRQKKHESFFFSDEDIDPASNLNHGNEISFSLIEEDENDSVSQTNSRMQSRNSNNQTETAIKEEQQQGDSKSSSDMDLDDIFPEPQKQSFSHVYKPEKHIQHNRKRKRIKRTPTIHLNTPVKIEDCEDELIVLDGRLRFRSQQRKIRTTVNEQKIKIMEHIFPYIDSNKPYKGTVLSLKDVAKIVDLGYSTILHKYKDFRLKGQVQKGLLLKCKDIKRKYNKSLILQKLIKKALKQQEFKTAKQLANFITQNYKFKANRSIISRHLNEMQREKFQFIEGKKQSQIKTEVKQQEQQILENLRNFSMIFLGLKNQAKSFYYFTTIRIYLTNKNASLELQDKQSNFVIINLVITATETSLIEYYFYLVNQTEVFMARRLTSLDSLAYQALYKQLQNKIEDDELDIQMSSDEEKAYIIFPFKQSKRQYEYRRKMLDSLLSRCINILTVPPRIQTKHFNFIQKWFRQQVMTTIEDMNFQDFEELKQHILPLMNKKQESLQNHAKGMLDSLRQFQ